MAGLTRTLPEVIRKAIAGRLQDIHVALPGRVERYDATTNLADVTVMVEHPVWDDDNGVEYEDLGILEGVPVCFMRAGGFMFTLPLAKGDHGLLLFASTPIGEWRSTGQKSKPVDSSRHSIGWPVFMPMLFPDTSQLPDVSARQAGPVLGKEGTNNQIAFGSDSIDVYKGGNPAARKGDDVNCGYLVYANPANATPDSYYPGTETGRANAVSRVTTLGAPAFAVALNSSGLTPSTGDTAVGGKITSGSGKVKVGG